MQPPLPQCLLGSACSSFYTLPFSCHSILFLHVPSEQEETCSPWLLGLLCVRGELRTVDSNREARGSLAGNCFLCQSCSASICLASQGGTEKIGLWFAFSPLKKNTWLNVTFLFPFFAFFLAERLSQLLQSHCVVQDWVVGLVSWMDVSPCWVQGYSRKPLNAEALQ